ncbi:hypothetical protein LX99_01708 [Mucilaginibacter oryzae]|uniref:Uncharacterized protein n=1 Tax=Mucilaginibacter oryzae TaxID=468058 RepID=A0A316HGR3_9SPHI|nr:hypothetical protein LX99_01708 [Mucilaginibacter oryzae]
MDTIVNKLKPARTVLIKMKTLLPYARIMLLRFMGLAQGFKPVNKEASLQVNKLPGVLFR